MDDIEKQDHIETDPFSQLQTLPDEAKAILLSAGSPEDAADQIMGLLGPEVAEQVLASFENLESVYNEVLKPAERDWELAKLLRKVIGPDVAAARTQGLDHQMRVSALYHWSAALASLRELRRSDNFTIDDDDTAQHVMKHVIEAMTSMIIVIESFKVDWEALKAQFFAGSKTMVPACDHGIATRQLIDFELGITDSWDAAPVLAVLAGDLVGMTGLFNFRYEDPSEADLQDMWRVILHGMGYVFPYVEQS